MKTSDLYINQSMMLESIKYRKKLSGIVEESDASGLKALGFMLIGKEWTEDWLEQDLGSAAIETLLDEIENSDHAKIMGTVHNLRDQGIIV